LSEKKPLESKSILELAPRPNAEARGTPSIAHIWLATYDRYIQSSIISMEHGRLKLFDLSGKVAVVTGGNGGIGLGMARGLASAGATVVIAARDLEKSQAAVEDLASRGTSVLTIPVDVTQEASLERCGRLDVLVNNAGTNIRHPAHELSLAQWHTVIDTNLTSAFMCAKAAYPTLKHGGGGKIINIGSMMSIFGAPVCACLRGQQRRHRPTDALARQRLGA
jgi:NADPH:quinone reductase-like Zn-dependent oxidoreductase